MTDPGPTKPTAARRRSCRGLASQSRTAKTRRVLLSDLFSKKLMQHFSKSSLLRERRARLFFSLLLYLPLFLIIFCLPCQVGIECWNTIALKSRQSLSSCYHTHYIHLCPSSLFLEKKKEMMIAGATSINFSQFWLSLLFQITDRH